MKRKPRIPLDMPVAITINDLRKKLHDMRVSATNDPNFIGNHDVAWAAGFAYGIDDAISAVIGMLERRSRPQSGTSNPDNGTPQATLQSGGPGAGCNGEPPREELL